MIQLSMKDCTVFDTFRQHATFELFSQTWHPVLPIVGALNKQWRKTIKEYWKKLLAPERIDICALYWKRRLFGVEGCTVGDYTYLHSELHEFVDGKREKTENLQALLTCILYNWPQSAQTVSKHCDFSTKTEQLNQIAGACFHIATGRRSMELLELICRLFIIERQLVVSIVAQMCSYGYKGIAYYLCQQYFVSIDDLRANENYALYHSIKNNYVEVVQWLLESYSYNVDEVRLCLNRLSLLYETRNPLYFSFSIPTKTLAYVESWLQTKIKKN